MARKKKKYDLGGGGWDLQLNTTRLVGVAEIIRDPRLQQRAGMDETTISRYIEVLQNGGELAPVKIVNEDGKLWMWDGYHTHEAAVQANVEKIRAEVERGTFRDAWVKSLGANDKHGLPRNRADLRNAIDNALSDPEVKYSLLNEDSKHTFRSLAKWIGVSHPTVSTRWNKHHLPLILTEVDNEVRGNPPVGVSLETWLDIIAEDHHAPGWFVKQRKLDLEAKAAAEAETKAKLETAASPSESNNNINSFLSGQITSDQTTSTSERNGEVEATSSPLNDGSHNVSIFDLEAQEEVQATSLNSDNERSITDYNEQHPERLRAYPAEHTLTKVAKRDLMEIIAGANKFGIHAYYFDHAVKIKVVYELDKEQPQEFELTPPHEGVLLLHFPQVEG